MFPVRLFRGYKSGIVATVSASLIGFQLGRDETFVTRVYFAGQSSANLGLGGKKKERKKERREGEENAVSNSLQEEQEILENRFRSRWRIDGEFLIDFFRGFPLMDFPRSEDRWRRAIPSSERKRTKSRRGLKNAGNLEDR